MSKAFSSPPASSSDKSLKAGAPILTPGGLTVHVTPAQLTAIKDVSAKLQANTRTIGAGASRLLRRKDPVTQKIETRRQLVTAVNGTIASFETHDVDSGELTAAGRLTTGELAPIRTAVGALSEERFDEVYALISGLITLQGAAEAIAPDSKIDITVREAAFLKDGETFKLAILTRFIPPSLPAQPVRIPMVSFEVHLSPSQPRPFDVTYVAYGRAAATIPYLDVTAISAP
ncbi:MAG: hypothetical protein HY075_10115 [Deltaproteobacteria bacterium]|nr:hypothetical protein [Deltaproteobacteria bacterium]